ncbi:ThiF family adenylyltransferase [Mesorhizobium huakuii]|uniref:ThiF family adenylyltransferase n=1 Tax=Mesorhizobium huakuii TaxID=28104 RepID=A0ABZ0VQN6_9HYPH|nr:ThiF family adenylyltransferase [Mesorhizobium huakuii]WQB99740.1 ThiF family adenylyltransferase [Mesorhizobium huakuii]
MRSEGQAWAIDQLDEIAKASAGSFEVLDIEEPEEEDAPLSLAVSIDCSRFSRVDGGVPLRARERLRISIPSRFPLSRPDAHFTHKRYADFAHVQWGDSICLYQATEVEWVPAQGMFGFMERVNEWLRAGAANELDPIGMPLHPPVAYATSNYSIVPCVDAPKPEHAFWGGFVEVSRDGDVTAELGRWFAYGEERPETRLASAILLPATMPHEYPTTMFDLIKALMARDVPLHLIHTIINLGALSTPAGKPAIFVLGAAMRGVAGGETRQHLASWLIDADQSQKLRDAVLATTPDEPKDIEAFYAWAADAKVEWCRVLEDRPEIVVRRDADSPSAFWKGKQVALLGCGAIGSTVAPILARAGVARLELYDYSVVTPGILVRQDFRRNQVGYTKSSALRVRLISARPDLDVAVHHGNILNVLNNSVEMERLMSVDVIIDATASRSISTAFELHFRRAAKKHPPIISMAIGHNADFGLMTLVKEPHAGMSVDADRRAKLSLANTATGKAYLEEYWPIGAARRKPFQPEPGCSSPTFRGSFADVLNLTSRMTNVAASWLATGASAPRAFAMDLSGDGLATGPAREIGFEWRPYRVMSDGQHGYQIRMSEEAQAAALAWIRRSERVRGKKVETGGLLFGEVDELLKVIWVDEVSGPPPDSVASPDGFLCGTAGVADMNAEKVRRTTGSVSFVGMWHTHPQALPIPSETDLGAMKELLGQDTGFLGRRFLMMIVGGTSKSPFVSVTVFHRSDYGG